MDHYHFCYYISEFQSEPSFCGFVTKSIDFLIDKDKHCKDHGHVKQNSDSIFINADKMPEIKFLFYEPEKDLDIPSMLVDIDDFFMTQVKAIRQK